MKLGKKTNRSIKILKIIDIYGTINASDIAENMVGLSNRNVMFICKKLVEVGILSSVRGPKGGYLIKRIPTLYELYTAFEKETEKSESSNILELHLNKIHCDLLAAMDSVFVL